MFFIPPIYLLIPIFLIHNIPFVIRTALLTFNSHLFLSGFPHQIPLSNECNQKGVQVILHLLKLTVSPFQEVPLI